MNNFREMVKKAKRGLKAITSEEMTEYKPVVVNACFGGFGLSEEARQFIDKDWKGNRDDINLVECVKNLGEKASDNYAQLEIEYIPTCYNFMIDEYDGLESIVLLPKKEVIKDLAGDAESLIAYLEAIDLFIY